MHNTLKQCVPLLTCRPARLPSIPRQLCQLRPPSMPRAHAYALSAGRSLCDHSKSKKGGVHHELMAFHDKDGDGAVSKAEFHEEL